MNEMPCPDPSALACHPLVLLARPLPRHDRAWKTQRVYRLHDGVLDLGPAHPGLERPANMASVSGFQAGPDAHAQFHQGKAPGVEGAGRIGGLADQGMCFAKLRESIDERIERWRCAIDLAGRRCWKLTHCSLSWSV